MNNIKLHMTVSSETMISRVSVLICFFKCCCPLLFSYYFAVMNIIPRKNVLRGVCLSLKLKPNMFSVLHEKLIHYTILMVTVI